MNILAYNIYNLQLTISGRGCVVTTIPKRRKQFYSYKPEVFIVDETSVAAEFARTDALTGKQAKSV